jgi:Uma2 family endonuclease
MARLFGRTFGVQARTEPESCLHLASQQILFFEMATAQTTQTPIRGAQVWPISVAAYHALEEAALIPERTELLYGFIYHKMSKSPFHSFLVTRLIRLLQIVLPPDCLLRSEQPVTCGSSEPEPDLAVVRGAEISFRDEHPKTAELVIEVCVSSHEYDRSKVRAYACASVKECWLILGPEKQIEVYRRPAGEGFVERLIFAPGSRVESSAIPRFSVDVAALFED